MQQKRLNIYIPNNCIYTPSSQLSRETGFRFWSISALFCTWGCRIFFFIFFFSMLHFWHACWHNWAGAMTIFFMQFRVTIYPLRTKSKWTSNLNWIVISFRFYLTLIWGYHWVSSNTVNHFLDNMLLRM